MSLYRIRIFRDQIVGVKKKNNLRRYQSLRVQIVIDWRNVSENCTPSMQIFIYFLPSSLSPLLPHSFFGSKRYIVNLKDWLTWQTKRVEVETKTDFSLLECLGLISRRKTKSKIAVSDRFARIVTQVITSNACNVQGRLRKVGKSYAKLDFVQAFVVKNERMKQRTTGTFEVSFPLSFFHPHSPHSNFEISICFQSSSNFKIRKKKKFI